MSIDHNNRVALKNKNSGSNLVVLNSTYGIVNLRAEPSKFNQTLLWLTNIGHNIASV